jgi:hypothetical protein
MSPHWFQRIALPAALGMLVLLVFAGRSAAQTTVTQPPASITTDKQSYQVGETIQYCYRVSTQGPFRVIDISPTGSQQVLVSGTGPVNQTCRTGTVTLPTGQECLRLEYTAAAGQTASVQTCFQVTQAMTPTPTPTPPHVMLSISTDRASYRVGDPITYCYTVTGAVPFRIVDISPNGTQQVILTGTGPVSNQCRTGTVTLPTGQECLRIETTGTQTVFSPTSTQVTPAQTCFQVTQAMTPTPTPTPPPGTASITTDRPSYRVGDPITYCYTVPGPSFVRIVNTLADGRQQVLLSGNDDGRGDCRLGTIGPPPGRECLRLEYSGEFGSGMREVCYQVLDQPMPTPMPTPPPPGPTPPPPPPTPGPTMPPTGTLTVVGFNVTPSALEKDCYTVEVVLRNASNTTVSRTITVREAASYFTLDAAGNERQVPDPARAFAGEDRRRDCDRGTVVGASAPLTQEVTVPPGQTRLVTFRVSHDWDWIPIASAQAQVATLLLGQVRDLVARVSNGQLTVEQAVALAIGASSFSPIARYQYTLETADLDGAVAPGTTTNTVAAWKAAALRTSLAATLAAQLTCVGGAPESTCLVAVGTAFITYEMAWDPDPRFRERVAHVPLTLPSLLAQQAGRRECGQDALNVLANLRTAKEAAARGAAAQTIGDRTAYQRQLADAMELMNAAAESQFRMLQCASMAPPSPTTGGTLAPDVRAGLEQAGIGADAVDVFEQGVQFNAAVTEPAVMANPTVRQAALGGTFTSFREVAQGLQQEVSRAGGPARYVEAVLDLSDPRKCIPDAGRSTCDATRLALWNGEPGTWATLGITDDGARFSSTVVYRVRAGDQAAIRNIAQVLGDPYLQITAIGFGRAGTDEYIEITNLGGGAQDMTGWTIRSPARGIIATFPDGWVMRPGQSCRVYSGVVRPDSCGDMMLPATDVWPDDEGEAVLFADPLGLLGAQIRYSADPANQPPPPNLVGR